MAGHGHTVRMTFEQLEQRQLPNRVLVLLFLTNQQAYNADLTYSA